MTNPKLPAIRHTFQSLVEAQQVDPNKLRNLIYNFRERDIDRVPDDGRRLLSELRRIGWLVESEELERLMKRVNAANRPISKLLDAIWRKLERAGG